jgi:hypothetical protein
MSHGHESGWAPAEIGLYIDHALGLPDAKPLPFFSGPPTLKDNTASVSLQSQTSITKAGLHYATPGKPERLPINKRMWTTVPAAIVNNQTITAPAPPADADLYFFSATDDRGAMVSSPVVIR